MRRHIYRSGMKTTLLVTVALLGAILLFTPTVESSSGKLVVVVGSDNPVHELTGKDLKDMFLGRRLKWADGVAVQPCDLVEKQNGDVARSVFAKEYLHKDAHTLKNYWIKMIFSGRGNPPMEFKRAKQVLRFVEETEGAIGYMLENQVTGDVKVVRIIQGSD